MSPRKQWSRLPTLATSTGLRVVALILGVVGSVAIARLGGTELKGISAFFAATSATAFTIINLDLAQQSLRQARSGSDLGLVWGYLRIPWALYATVALAAAVAAFVADIPFAWYVFGACTFALGAQAGVAAVGTRGAVVGSLGAIIQQLFVIAAVGVLWTADALNSTSVILAVGLSFAAPLCLYLPVLLIEHRKRKSRAGAPTVSAVIRIVPLGLPWQLGRLMLTMLLKLDVIAVMILLGANHSGIYSVSISTAMLCTLIPAQVANQTLYDASRNGEVDIHRLQRDAFIAGALTSIPFAVAGKFLIVVLYGSEFETAHSALLAALPGTVAYGVIQVQCNYIRVVGSWKQFLTGSAAGAAGMTVALVVLVPLIGTAGAGLSFTIGATIGALVGMLTCRRLSLQSPD